MSVTVLRPQRLPAALLFLLLWAVVPARAQAQEITLMQYQFGKAEEVVKPKDVINPSAYAYKLSIGQLPMTAKWPAEATGPQIEPVIMAGPTFDADEAARQLLLAQRRYARSSAAVRKAVKADPQARLLLLPSAQGQHGLCDKWKRTGNMQEQELARGYCQTLAAQLRQQYAQQAPGHVASTFWLAADDHPRPQLTLLPGQYPRFVAPGTVLHFPFPQLNWLKYAPTVTSQGRLYEYSQTALPSLTPTKEKPAGPLPGARPLTAREKADDLSKRLSKYNTLVRQLDDAYAADYLDERPSTKDGYAKQAQELFPPVDGGGPRILLGHQCC